MHAVMPPRAVTGQRHAATLPQVAAQAGYTRTNHVDEFGIPQPNSPSGRLVIYPDIPNNYRTRLDVQWPIYTGGRLEAPREQRPDSTRTRRRVTSTRRRWTSGSKSRARSGRLVVTGESQRVLDESLARRREHVRDVRNQLRGRTRAAE